MSISASEVMKLRQATGLAMMACKKALIEADGDMELAIENLRKQGEAKAVKRADKSANEGKVAVVSADNGTIVYEVNSETDFVAKNDEFLGFVENVGTVLAENKPADLAAASALESPLFDGQSLEKKTLELVGKIGEKIHLRRFAVVETAENEKAFSYLHGNGKIGVVVVLASDNADVLNGDDAAVAGKDVAMQIAAQSPVAVRREDIAEDVIAKEKEIFLEQVKQSGKPEKIWDKIVEGKLNKYYSEVTLVEQNFVKDPDITVEKRVASVDASLTVKSFVRYELGA